MSGFFRSSPSKKPNVVTFPPPDLGMLRGSRRVLIFPNKHIYYIVRALTCQSFKSLLSRGSRAVFFAFSRSLDLSFRSFLRLAVAFGSEGRARATLALAPPRRWL